MKRIYTDGISSTVKMFTGIEIEKTPAYGQKTLFVVGLHPIEDIKRAFNGDICTHIFLGANQSFNITGEDDPDSDQWVHMIKECLKLKIWVSIDFEPRLVEWICEGGFAENNMFIPQISVKVPYADQLGYNAMVKIDDKGFNISNPGVWCHRLRDLQSIDQFTHWSEYGKDTPI